MSYADDLQAVSVDEALIDVSSTVENARRHAAATKNTTESPDFAKELAETIRREVRSATGCEGERLAVFSRNKIPYDS